MQLAFAKLISKMGLLMQLLREQQEVKVSKAQWMQTAGKVRTMRTISMREQQSTEEEEQESSEVRTTTQHEGLP